MRTFISSFSFFKHHESKNDTLDGRCRSSSKNSFSYFSPIPRLRQHTIWYLSQTFAGVVNCYEVPRSEPHGRRGPGHDQRGGRWRQRLNGVSWVRSKMFSYNWKHSNNSWRFCVMMVKKMAESDTENEVSDETEWKLVILSNLPAKIHWNPKKMIISRKLPADVISVWLIWRDIWGFPGRK